MDDPEFVAQAVKYYKAVLESKKKAWKKKNPEPKPRGRPKKVAEGGPRELEAYLAFLKGGCAKWPLDLLRDAGVDLEKPEPVATALAQFGRLVDELDSLL
jgi:oligoendopeptidase F